MAKQSSRQRRNQAIRHVVLGLLAEEPGHGYNVMKRLEAVWGPAADLNPSSVYLALKHHASCGNASAKEEPPEGHDDDAADRGPTYYITPKGLATWERFLQTRSKMEAIRGEFAPKIALARPEHALALQRAKEDYELQVLDRIAEHAAALDELRESLPGGESAWRALAYTRATRHLNAELEWIREDVGPAVEQLRELAVRAPRRRGHGGV